MKFDYIEAGSTGEAIELLDRYNGKAVLIAGGTDLVVKFQQKARAAECVVGIGRIKELSGIVFGNQLVRIRANTSLREVEQSAELQSQYPVLPETARQMASVAVRNVGTIGGNLCNAAPSADMAAPLLVLSASLTVVSKAGEREVAVDTFFKGPGMTVLNSGEILKEICLPLPPTGSGTVYFKFGSREASDLAIVGVAAMIVMDENKTCKDVKIGLSAVAPTPIRAQNAEALLMNQVPDEELIGLAGKAAAEAATPITDVRGSKEYRHQLIEVFTRNAIREALVRARRNMEGRPR